MEILLSGAESKVVDAVVSWYVSTGDGNSGYTRIVGFVEGDDVVWKSKECLKDEVEAWSRVEVPSPFEDDVEVLGAGDEVGFERSKADSDRYREAESLSVNLHQ